MGNYVHRRWFFVWSEDGVTCNVSSRRLWIKKYAESDPASEASGQTTSMVRLNLPMVVGPPPTDTSRGIEIHIGDFRVMISERANLSYLESVLRIVREAAG